MMKIFFCCVLEYKQSILCLFFAVEWIYFLRKKVAIYITYSVIAIWRRNTIWIQYVNLDKTYWTLRAVIKFIHIISVGMRWIGVPNNSILIMSPYCCGLANPLLVNHVKLCIIFLFSCYLYCSAFFITTFTRFACNNPCRYIIYTDLRIFGINLMNLNPKDSWSRGKVKI